MKTAWNTEVVLKENTASVSFLSPEHCWWGNAAAQGLRALREPGALQLGAETQQNGGLCCFPWEAFRLVCFQLHFLESDLVSAHIRILSWILFKIKCFKKSTVMQFKVIQKVWVGLEFLLQLKGPGFRTGGWLKLCLLYILSPFWPKAFTTKNGRLHHLSQGLH